MYAKSRGAVAQQLIVKRALRILRALLLLVITAQLQQHQLASRVHQVRRIESASLGLAPRAAFFHEALIAEKPDALLHRPILHVKANAHDETPETNKRFGELAQLECLIVPAETGFDHHLLGVVCPAFDKRRGG